MKPRSNPRLRHRASASTALLLMVISPLALGYIGPGSGISVIGSLLALLATIGLAFFAIVMFPVRKMMKQRGNEAEDEDDDDEQVAVAKENAEGR